MAGGGLTRLQILSETHKAWLDFYYKESQSLTETAKQFSVSDTAVSEVRDSPAGTEYASKIMGTTRATINLKVANLILSRVDAAGPQLPLDILVKIYSATLPKDSPATATESLRAEADKLADEYNLSPETRTRLMEFVLSGGKMSAFKPTEKPQA